MTKLSSRSYLFTVGILVTFVVFVIDVVTPIGIEIWVFYLPVLLLMVFSSSIR